MKAQVQEVTVSAGSKGRVIPTTWPCSCPEDCGPLSIELLCQFRCVAQGCAYSKTVMIRLRYRQLVIPMTAVKGI